ncbi:error-prone DNA polymerase [Gryllotalpicola sp.]|uniref:error-prone DNA polymerase n=1 Tax=Gryllotalpicola sp. TaxID=1932787 RepID=UPI0026140D8B|nr:error-prone DNA polymerase [Gryllotalpicola sp.]
MGFSNPPIPWSELERTLSDRDASGSREPERPSGRKRRRELPDPPLVALGDLRDDLVTPYAELHAHSSFSFLDGASDPARLVAEAARLRLAGLAITDHDGLYGVVRMAEAAEVYSTELKTVFGAELSLGLGAPQSGIADPEGSHLLVLARGAEGYHALAAALTEAQLAGDAEKGRPEYSLERLAERGRGRWTVLTGCRKGAVRQALTVPGVDRGSAAAAAGRELDRLIDLFGRENVLVELYDHGEALASTWNDALAGLAASRHLAVVATGNVHYATPAQRPLADAVAAVRARRSLDELDPWLPAGSAHLRSGAEMAALFRRYPGAVERTVDVAAELAFSLRKARPGLPMLDVPAGHTPMSRLRELVEQGIREKYAQERRPGLLSEVRVRMESELKVIENKDFPGYFLIVHDIVQFARRRGILCQGRGSAANSAVCYVLGITSVDPIFYRLPFERFLSSLRPEEPDIDVDFEAGRREEVIQYVYGKYGRDRAAQVATVISYQPKAAVRDMAKALGHSPGQQDAWSKRFERSRGLQAGDSADIPSPVLELAEQLRKAPRHLGIHSGGMVLTRQPVGEVCPIEHARMVDRTVLQWDKDDCEWMGLVKFDLLGLGMLSAIHQVFDQVGSLGESWTIETIPREEPAVYDMLCRADAIGVFQVESRAQLATLPRLKPRRFYDLVVEVALIRPGPIQGGAVHPYIRRRAGEEKVTYQHPALEPVLKRTYGVPLFQEQVMQMAVAVGGCSPEDADLLRRSMGSKRGQERIETLQEKLFAGMAANGITEADAQSIYGKIKAFADFGFAESHALSFAVLVYASSWLKLHYPAAFLAGLLRSQPMGFYSSQTLVADAVRHGVEVRQVDIARSEADAALEPIAPARTGPTGRASCLQHTTTRSGDPDDLDEADEFDPSAPDGSAEHRRDGASAVRLGLAQVRAIGSELAARIVAEREASGSYRDQYDLAERVGLSTLQLESLAAAGAFESFGKSRREAIWIAGSASRVHRDHLPGSHLVVQPPLLPALGPADRLAYDMWATGVSPDDHPLRHERVRLASSGVLTAVQLATHEPGRRVSIGGVVTHRQHPTTAGGITFLNLEDETGLTNVVVARGVWQKYRRVARESSALVVRGILQRSPEGVISVVADRIDPLPIAVRTTSRDFR